jgi:hypothetical protein
MKHTPAKATTQQVMSSHDGTPPASSSPISPGRSSQNAPVWLPEQTQTLNLKDGLCPLGSNTALLAASD